MTQNDRVLAWLRRGRSLTAAEAVRRWSIHRLAARVRDLRDRGVDVQCHLESRGRVHWARYYL